MTHPCVYMYINRERIAHKGILINVYIAALRPDAQCEKGLVLNKEKCTGPSGPDRGYLLVLCHRPNWVGYFQLSNGSSPNESRNQSASHGPKPVFSPSCCVLFSPFLFFVQSYEQTSFILFHLRLQRSFVPSASRSATSLPTRPRSSGGPSSPV